MDGHFFSSRICWTLETLSASHASSYPAASRTPCCGTRWWMDASWGRLSKSHCRHTFRVPQVIAYLSVFRSVWDILSASQKGINAFCTIESHIVVFHDQQTFSSANISSWSVSTSNNINNTINTDGMTHSDHSDSFFSLLGLHLHPLSPVDCRSFRRDLRTDFSNPWCCTPIRKFQT